MGSTATTRARIRSWTARPWSFALLALLGLIVMIALDVVVGLSALGLWPGLVGRLYAVAGVALLAGVISGVLSSRRPTMGPAVVVPVRELRDLLVSDTRRGAPHRRTGATLASLRRVLEVLDAADSDLTRHQELRGGARLQDLGSLTDDWDRGSEERRRAVELVGHAEKIAKTYAWTARLPRSRKRGGPDRRDATPADPLPPTGTRPPIDVARLPAPEAHPEVMRSLEEGDLMGAAKAYRARTGEGLAASDAAVVAAARRHGLRPPDA